MARNKKGQIVDGYGDPVEGYEDILGDDEAVYAIKVDCVIGAGLVDDTFLVAVDFMKESAEDAIEKVMQFIKRKVKQGAAQPAIRGIRVERVGYRLK